MVEELDVLSVDEVVTPTEEGTPNLRGEVSGDVLCQSNECEVGFETIRTTDPTRDSRKALCELGVPWGHEGFPVEGGEPSVRRASPASGVEHSMLDARGWFSRAVASD